jgi:dihydrofolate reductase
VVSANPAELLEAVERRGLSRLWLVGGSSVAGSYLAAGLITECIVTVIPVVLGRGVPLFVGGEAHTWMGLRGSREYPSGVVSLHFQIPRGGG